MYASDGLPQYYYTTKSDIYAMTEIRRAVFDTLDRIDDPNVTTEELCEMADINVLFICDVEDYRSEWKESVLEK